MRWTLGPSFGTVAFQTAAGVETETSAPVAPHVPVKTDVEVSVEKGIVDGKAVVTIPAHDLATQNAPAEVRVYVLPEGTALPTSADDLVNPPAGATAHAFGAFDATALAGSGGEAPVPLPSVPDGTYLLPVVVGFAE